MTADDTTLTLKPADVVKLLGLRRDVVVKLMETGRLRAENTGLGKHAYWRTSEAWVADYLRGQTVGLNTQDNPETPDNTRQAVVKQA